MALGASLQADVRHGAGFFTMGLGTFIAIVLHKPLDALSVTSLMRGANLSEKFQTLVNGAFAMMCPLGAFLFRFGAEMLPEQNSLIVGMALAFSAGVFLCISLSDLLPEMEFHSHHRTSLSVALLAGIGLAWGLRWLEPAGAHVLSLL
jgi:zinc and cadmium transporter